VVILAVDPHWPYRPPARFDRYPEGSAEEPEQRDIAASLPFVFRTVMFAAYLPLALVLLRDAGWGTAEPIRRAMLQGMVVLSFVFAAHQCFSTM